MTGAPRLLVGIDKGSSVTKATVFDEYGTQLAWASRRVQVLHPRPGWHEEDPDVNWDATAAAVREALGLLPAGAVERIAGVAVAGHMGGVWLLDGHGRPTRNAIPWPDARATAAMTALQDGPHHEEYLDISGCAALPGMTLFLLAHLAEHEPDVLAASAHVLFAKDWVQYRLTGGLVTDPSDVCFAPGDFATATFSPRLAELLGAGAGNRLLPEIAPFGEIIGPVTAVAAAETGLPAGTPVVNGLGDAVAAMFGSGAIRPGEAATVLGTSWLNMTVVPAPVMRPRGIGWVYPMPGGTWVHVLANTSGAATLDWWLATLLGTGPVDFAALEAEIGTSPEAAGALTFLPYLSAAGVQSPFKDEHVRGTLLGLTDSTSRADLLRAVYEGLAYSVCDNYDAQGVRPHLVRLSGGGSRSAIWPGTISNALGATVDRLASNESASLGVALLAGVAVGLWPDTGTAVDAMVHVTRRIEPEPGLTARHAEALGRYRSAQTLARAFFAPPKGDT